MENKNRKLEIEYTYQGNRVGRVIALLFGVGIAAGSWYAFSDGILWIRGIDERTSSPAFGTTLGFFAIGILIVVFALLPWPRFKDRAEEFHRRN